MSLFLARVPLTTLPTMVSPVRKNSASSIPLPAPVRDCVQCMLKSGLINASSHLDQKSSSQAGPNPATPLCLGYQKEKFPLDSAHVSMAAGVYFAWSGNCTRYDAVVHAAQCTRLPQKT
uniref:Uncharacterized protein n=1 Tax=Moniliophthora roreri TaxID=221103 RepID=A0A0W0FJR0_MONRR